MISNDPEVPSVTNASDYIGKFRDNQDGSVGIGFSGFASQNYCMWCGETGGGHRPWCRYCVDIVDRLAPVVSEPPKQAERWVKVRVPRYDARTNYHVAGLAKCGVDVVEFPPLMMDCEKQYLFPDIDPYTSETKGAFFFVRSKDA
jgi:hypothetical protein